VMRDFEGVVRRGPGAPDAVRGHVVAD
jgi:hypothetical protein